MAQRTLSPEHVAAMQAGRERVQAQRTADTERRKAEYSVWSKSNAGHWMAWRDNCGLSQCTCEWCIPYRASNSAMPDKRGVDAETE